MGVLRGFLALKSLILGLVILALWGRSYFVGDLVRKGSDAQYIELGSAAGSAIITFRHDGQKTTFGGKWQYVSHEEPRPMLVAAGLGDSVWNRVGFGFQRRVAQAPAHGMIVTLIMPHWLIFLLAIPSALRWAVRRARAKQDPVVASDEERFAMHECPHCGQLYARVPAMCSVCRNPIAGGSPAESGLTSGQ